MVINVQTEISETSDLLDGPIYEKGNFRQYSRGMIEAQIEFWTECLKLHETIYAEE